MNRITFFVVAVCGWWGGAAAQGEVVRFEIDSREVFAEGKEFGEVGPYERIRGTVYYAISHSHPRNRAIRDLVWAPRSKNGMVEFSADLDILAPVDLTKGNGALLYDVNNRGRKLALRFFNDAPGENDPRDVSHAGNGFLMRKGYVIVWSGWDGELLPGDNRLQLFAPTASKHGQSFTGPVRYELAPDKGATRLPVNRANHGAYRPTEAGWAGATLTWRLRVDDTRIPIPRDQFKLHVSEVKPSRDGQLPLVELEVPAGMRKGYLYELIYEAQDPLVHGVCFAAVSDLISAIKHGDGKDHPLLVQGKPAIKRAYGFGVSQSGRFLREMLYWAFDQDEQRPPRLALDGVIPHVAGGGLGSFNHRFAQPTAFATQRDLHDWPTDRFPFAYGNMQDPLSRQKDGVLRLPRRVGGVPKVMHTQSSAEYWSRSGSLVHTDPLGRVDAEIPGNVRIYTFGGTQHGPAAYPPSNGKGQAPSNPGDYKPFLRALLTSLDAWVGQSQRPPDSVYPTIAQGTLVGWTREQTMFPYIPGVRYPQVIQQPALLDFGSQWRSKGVVTTQPPGITPGYRVLVPRCRAIDGNEEGCLLPPEVEVSVATYTGWNLRSAEAGAENELVSLNGSFYPLPPTADSRAASGDPRLSLGERYGGLQRYLQKLRSYCAQLVKQGYLLEEDVEGIMNRQQEVAAPFFANVGP